MFPVAVLVLPVALYAFWSAETAAPVPQSVTAQSASGVQTMPVLLPLAAAALPLAQGGADIIVADQALIATGGPIGESQIAPKRASDIRLYTVREGDSLSQVAEMFGVTTNTILWANDLPKATQVQPGETLVILPVPGVQHTVAPGDTLSTIAKQYEGEAKQILSFNELSDASQLIIGDTIIIPDGVFKSVTTKAAEAAPVRSAAGVASRQFVHPAPGAVRTQGIHGNNAVDLAAGHGAPIRAAAAGQVVVSKSSGWNGGYGQYIVIKHSDGTQTLYSHLSRNYVGVGAWVSQGESIGAMGSTGRSTGTHLHFEVRGARNPF